MEKENIKAKHPKIDKSGEELKHLYDLKIPVDFKLFGSEVKVIWDNKASNDHTRYGSACYSTHTITLSHTNGLDKLSDDRIMDSFYHEKVHIILDTMHEYELSKNEKFVDQFAKLLRQADETSRY